MVSFINSKWKFAAKYQALLISTALNNYTRLWRGKQTSRSLGAIDGLPLAAELSGRRLL